MASGFELPVYDVWSLSRSIAAETEIIGERAQDVHASAAARADFGCDGQAGVGAGHTRVVHGAFAKALREVRSTDERFAAGLEEMAQAYESTEDDTGTGTNDLAELGAHAEVNGRRGEWCSEPILAAGRRGLAYFRLFDLPHAPLTDRPHGFRADFLRRYNSGASLVVASVRADRERFGLVAAGLSDSAVALRNVGATVLVSWRGAAAEARSGRRFDATHRGKADRRGQARVRHGCPGLAEPSGRAVRLGPPSRTRLRTAAARDCACALPRLTSRPDRRVDPGRTSPTSSRSGRRGERADVSRLRRTRTPQPSARATSSH